MDENKKIDPTFERLKAYHKMVNASHDCITLIDKNYTYQEVNSTYLKKVHLDRSALVGHHIREVWGEFVFNTVIKDKIDECLSGKIINYQSWVDFSEKKGERSYVDVTYSPYTNSQGEFTHVVVTTHDISKLKYTEGEMLKSLKSAEEASKAKSQFLANMSHEIRTPMHGMINMVESIKDSPLDSDQKNCLQILESSLDALSTIINDILDYSKIEAGKLDIENIPFDLRNTIYQVCQLFDQKIKDKGLEFSCLVNSDIPQRLQGDPGRIKQILMNLISNAIKFTHQGDICLSVVIEKQKQNKIVLKYSLKDSGVGIPANIQNKIFAPFDQADQSTSRNFGGTGLGLAICKQLSGLMNGDIGVESREGEGSSFWFTSELLVEEKPVKTEAQSIYKKRAFIFSESEHLSLQVKEYLTSWDCEVEVGFDASSIIQNLISKNDLPYDFIIVIQDNKCLYKSFDSLSLSQKVPLLLLTAPGQRGEAKKVKELGFSVYLTHPAQHDDLRQSMQMLTSQPEQKEIITHYSVEEIQKSHISILLVEDNLSNQKIVSRILGREGYQVDIAENGQKGVEAFMKSDYNLILMDCRMPIMDGYEATKKIKSSDRPKVPVLALTADADEASRQRSIKAGMDDRLTKPFKKSELLDIVAKWVFT